MKKLLYLLMLCYMSSCTNITDQRLEEALRMAGHNRAELENVLKHYEQDSLKFKAARYLIENMPYHYSSDEYFLSPKGGKYRPDILKMKGEEEVKRHCDSLIDCGYTFYHGKKQDVLTINSSFLIKQIDLAFSVWQKPWAKDVLFNDFCRYILPYRVSHEALSNKRVELISRYMPLLDSAKVTNSLAACILINKQLKKLMRYKRTGLPFYPTIEETYDSGFGQCEGLCDLGTFVMRSLGIPVTVDQTIWTKMDLSHVWCSVLYKGRFYPFGPSENSPIEYDRIFSQRHCKILAKIYRYRFDPFPYHSTTPDDGYVTFLKSPLCSDVTKEYLAKCSSRKCISVRVNVDNKNLLIKSGQVYLCVYNFYKFEPLAIGKQVNSFCEFEQVVGDNIFIVADSPDGYTLRYITSPFYVDVDGRIQKMIPKGFNKTFTFYKRKDALNKSYTLSYWNTMKHEFISLHKINETDSTQTYNTVPRDALLWFTMPDKICNQRVFVIRNDSLKYY